MIFYYADTDEIALFFLLLERAIFTTVTGIEDTTFTLYMLTLWCSQIY